MQLRYAADDVRYLLAVHDEIGKQLTAWVTPIGRRKNANRFAIQTNMALIPKLIFSGFAAPNSFRLRNQADSQRADDLAGWRRPRS